MNSKVFWDWFKDTDSQKRVLYLCGTIASESWFDDDVTPETFRNELHSDDGDIILWINSPGGDVIAGSQIYNMLIDYPGKVSVHIDSIAASAASVIAMAGDEVLMSPVSMLMIHNPMTVAIGDYLEMDKAKEMLGSFKEAIINAYEQKTKLDREKLSKLMDAETWMDASKAMELGFCDGLITKNIALDSKVPTQNMMFSRKAVTNSLLFKIKENNKVTANELNCRLETIKNTWR